MSQQKSQHLILNKDKLYHFLAGAVVVVIASFLVAIKLGLVACFLVAIAKEAYDHKFKGTVDAMDFVATVVGGMFAAAILV